MDATVTTDSPCGPKCGSDRVHFEEFGRPRGKKAAAFVVLAICYAAASVVAFAVETNTLPTDSPAWLKAIAQSLAASELGKTIIVEGVIMVIMAYMFQAGSVDALGVLAKWLGSPERRCQLCGHRWPLT
jgi:hypothetical protein